MVNSKNMKRRNSSVAHVGNIAIGGDNPIRVQSMTTTNTNDTNACVEQAIRIIEAGGELVRLTTQGRREAENLKNISEELRHRGYDTPLVADVHFNATMPRRYASTRATTSTRLAPSNIWNTPTRSMPTSCAR